MRTVRPIPGAVALASVAFAGMSCATLSGILGVEPPAFQHAADRPSTLRLALPSSRHPSGAVTVRLWARVTNPNDFGLRLSTLEGTLALEDRDVADVVLPLGLPLEAGRDTVVPLDVTFGRSALDAVGDVGRALLTRSSLAYALSGTVAVDAGPFGTPTFGPRRWLSGEVRVEAGSPPEPGPGR